MTLQRGNDIISGQRDVPDHPILIFPFRATARFTRNFRSVSKIPNSGKLRYEEIKARSRAAMRKAKKGADDRYVKEKSA
jgi:hypothetical protein